ncbi:hypothetical protein BC939DRAFT_205614 [Gamsiella multidivaricata]|uniref:uncharacterized protein n=1 Tax=Gamsiella multidivaricata TaxID=101098 RepID=UPI00221EDAE2|nr:uncharacterized protein BC939DRAFT_205614 [Gamsiella multidivaricata]KAI7821566.1 hypothetical protein BC939DRAFT_205614 [Gamsiella multidivaricata]
MEIQDHFTDKREKDAAASKRHDKDELVSPDAYNLAYSSLRRWVEASLDLYKPGLISILSPLFVHSCLSLVSRGFKDQDKVFMEAFRSVHLEMHSQDITRVAAITDMQYAQGNELAAVSFPTVSQSHSPAFDRRNKKNAAITPTEPEDHLAAFPQANIDLQDAVHGAELVFGCRCLL